MTAPPFWGSLQRWISHQRAMSRRTRLRVDCDLSTLPVNVRTSREPSLSTIRQCRKATSKGSSFFSEKFTLNIGPGWVCVILPPHCVRSLGSVYHSHWSSIRFADTVFGQADTAQLLYLSILASTPASPIREKDLDEPDPEVCNYPGILPGRFPIVSLRRSHWFCGSLRPLPCLVTGALPQSLDAQMPSSAVQHP
jgi:hypothetical protein